MILLELTKPKISQKVFYLTMACAEARANKGVWRLRPQWVPGTKLLGSHQVGAKAAPEGEEILTFRMPLLIKLYSMFAALVCAIVSFEIFITLLAPRYVYTTDSAAFATVKLISRNTVNINTVNT